MNDIKHEGWIASLSNGDTVHEQPVADGEMSSWQQLLRYLKARDLRITMMRLQHGHQTIVADPHADGYVQAYQLRKSLFSGQEHHYHGVGSVFGETVFFTWMDRNGEITQDVVSLSTVRVHSTMDWQSK
jgi:hypothetical protein